MTLEAYTPTDLDSLALRVLDLAARLRAMSHKCAEHELASFPLHDKKALEWLSRLEEFVHKGEHEQEKQIFRAKGAKRARAADAS